MMRVGAAVLQFGMLAGIAMGIGQDFALASAQASIHRGATHWIADRGRRDGTDQAEKLCSRPPRASALAVTF